MITERKAIQEIFDDLQRERKELKANYRADLARIEERQELLLERLARLDNIEREAVDSESLLQEMQRIAGKMAECIPDIPADILLEKTAEKMAAASKEQDVNPPFIIKSDEKEQKNNQKIKKEQENLSEAEKITKMPHGTIAEVIEAIEDILREAGKPMRSREISEALWIRKGWEWGNFNAAFSGWRTKPQYNTDNIIKLGRLYGLKEWEAEKDGQQAIKIQETNLSKAAINGINRYSKGTEMDE